MDKYFKFSTAIFCVVVALLSVRAEATFRNRLSVIGGVMYEVKRQDYSLEGTAELETRLGRYVGIGAFGSHVLSDPEMTIIGAPTFYLHLYRGNDWFVSLSPMILLEGGRQHFGSRFGTRAKINLGVTRLYPSWTIAFARGETMVSFGIGVDLVNAYSGIAPIR